MLSFAVFISLAYFSFVNGAYLNSLRAADSILARVNGDYTPRKVYFPNYYSNDKVWNADHTSYEVTQEVNCVNGSVYFTNFQRLGFPEMDGDAENLYLKFVVNIGSLRVGYSNCDGISTAGPQPTQTPTSTNGTTPAPSPTIPTGTPTPIPPRANATSTPAGTIPASVSANSTAAGGTTATPTQQPPTSLPHHEGSMRSDFLYSTQMEVKVAIRSTSDSCTTWVDSLKPNSLSWDSTGYWNDVFVQIQRNLMETFQYELKPVFQSALSETHICYLLD